MVRRNSHRSRNRLGASRNAGIGALAIIAGTLTFAADPPCIEGTLKAELHNRIYGLAPSYSPAAHEAHFKAIQTVSHLEKLEPQAISYRDRLRKLTYHLAREQKRREELIELEAIHGGEWDEVFPKDPKQSLRGQIVASNIKIQTLLGHIEDLETHWKPIDDDITTQVWAIHTQIQALPEKERIPIHHQLLKAAEAAARLRGEQTRIFRLESGILALEYLPKAAPDIAPLAKLSRFAKRVENVHPEKTRVIYSPGENDLQKIAAQVDGGKARVFIDAESAARGRPSTVLMHERLHLHTDRLANTGAFHLDSAFLSAGKDVDLLTPQQKDARAQLQKLQITPKKDPHYETSFRFDELSAFAIEACTEYLEFKRAIKQGKSGKQIFQNLQDTLANGKKLADRAEYWTAEFQQRYQEWQHQPSELITQHADKEDRSTVLTLADGTQLEFTRPPLGLKKSTEAFAEVDDHLKRLYQRSTEYREAYARLRKNFERRTGGEKEQLKEIDDGFRDLWRLVFKGRIKPKP